MNPTTFKRSVMQLTVGFSCLGILAPHALAQAVQSHVGDLDFGSVSRLVDENSDELAGLEFDEAFGKVIVYAKASQQVAGLRLVTKRAGAIAASGGTAERPYFLEVRPVKRSKRELDQLMNDVTRNHAWVNAAGGELREWYVEPATGAVVLGVAAVTPALEKAARAAIGSDVVLRTADIGTRASDRLNDFEPWAGGIRISVPGGQCSAAFAFTDGNPWEFLTAGHCFGGVGTGTGQTVSQNGTLVGTTTYKFFTDFGFDIAHYGGPNYAAWTYTGGVPGGGGLSVKGEFEPIMNSTICTNGSFTGEKCIAKVNTVGACKTFSDGVTTCHLSRADTTTSSGIVQSGDSGGGLHKRGSGGVLASGVIVGQTGSGVVWFHPLSQLRFPTLWQVATE